MEQSNSLTNQISAPARLVSTDDEWKLVDCYVDIASAKGKSPRVNFQRMTSRNIYNGLSESWSLNFGSRILFGEKEFQI